MTPLDVPCPCCKAGAGVGCVTPHGHTALGYVKIHASRRAEAGDNSGPMHPPPKRYIKSFYTSGQWYRHPCGQYVKKCSSRGWVFEDNSSVDWRMGQDERCPTCKRPLWAEDLGPDDWPTATIAPENVPQATEQLTLL